MRRLVAVVLAAMAMICVEARADDGQLEAGFRNPPANCRPTMGWFHSGAFAATLAKCPPHLRLAFERALADGGLSTTPEEIKRMAAWQALTDAGAISQPGLPARPPAQPYGAFASLLHGTLARIVFLCSSTKPEGGIFTQEKPAHGITIYPPTPDVYFARRRLGNADVYLAVSQRKIDSVVTITFPRVAAPELWDPDDGSIREAPTYYAQGGNTMLNLRLGPYQALFVVLRKPPSKQHVAFATSLQVTGVQPDGAAVRGLARVNGRCSVMFATGAMAVHDVNDLPPPLPLRSGWTLKTRAPARRGAVGVVAARVHRADIDREKPAEWASPPFDDSAWAEVEIGRQQAAGILATPWEANWLTFHGDRQERLFRRAFDLAESPDFATVTLTGDNGYELFVNGTRIGADGDWRAAETYDVIKALRKGRNVFAVRNTNEGGIGGLLLEARIRLASGKLLTIVTDGTWKMAQKAAEGWQKPDFDDAAWAKPQVGGKPPVPPWHDVSGLPAPPTSGQAVWYRFRLPAGARTVRLPSGLKEPQLYVDGKPVPVRDGVADLAGRVPRGPVVAALRTAGLAAIDRPILCDCGQAAVGIGSWLLIGYATYSGLADYAAEVQLPEAYHKERLILDLGSVGCAAQVAVNGRDLGTRLWQPYTFDITDAVRGGKNTIEVTVANTAANASGRDLPAERLAAGILGPVRVRCLRQVTIKAK